MKFFLYSDVCEESIGRRLGASEYSYFFVLKAYRRVLEKLGTVEILSDLQTVPARHEACRAAGEYCLLIAFTPPHKAPIGLACPTLCVFAWEFTSLPDQPWHGDARNDWRVVLRDHGRSICLSSHTAQVVKDALGADYPVLALPTPIWEQFAPLRACFNAMPVCPGITLQGQFLDTRDCPSDAQGILRDVPAPRLLPPEPATSTAPTPPVLTPGIAAPAQHPARRTLALYRHHIRQRLPLPMARLLSRSARQSQRLLKRLLRVPPPPAFPAAPAPEVISIPNTPAEPPRYERSEKTLGGVVYTTVFSPTDGRKNWHDIVTAFCWAHREHEDATLLLKMTCNDPVHFYDELKLLLLRLSPLKCRVLAQFGYLESADFEKLMTASSFYVNASHCEGLCMPLMEFMSLGIPAIAPMHTAMADYVDEQCGFIVSGSLEHNVWPHDPEHRFTTWRMRIHWQSLHDAFLASYVLAKNDPETYRQRGLHAQKRIETFCNEARVTNLLATFLAPTAALVP